MKRCLLSLPSLAFAAPVAVASEAAVEKLPLINHNVGFAAIAIFAIAYLLVMVEEFTHLRKSKPVILAAGIIWAMIAYVYAQNDLPGMVEQAVRHNVLEFAELMLFLLVAMTYINAMEERMVFESLRSWLTSKGFSYRQLFWLTGTLAFLLSPVADNLTTALLMGAVVMAIGSDSPRFVAISCINIVVAANAGGAFSPFGDITTLMVWQKGIVEFWTFFNLITPSLVNFLVPAAFMHFAIPDVKPEPCSETVIMKRGAWIIMGLFLATITTAVCFHNFLHLPPMLGMMTGLAYLQIFGFYLRKTHNRELPNYSEPKANEMVGDVTAFEVFRQISRAEWDTLLFFYGVVLCVGGLGFIGYLELVSTMMYVEVGPTFANVMVGLLSAVVDNIPVMFAVLTMDPVMSQGQWLLVTLTAGVGGSMLSIGSAAGVALMGQARGTYTFSSHLRWTPVILLGYTASIFAHMWVNSRLF
ncbi:MAG: sodium:proton antiporter NhaD [Gammaproteobacteria bacterium]|jgi:NhaD family Na+/H+ antiporter|nr:sodium:proton antiporter NhaD [Gammaproteobacteria bacterium]